MGWIKKNIHDELETVRVRSLRENVKVLKQVGSSNLKRDLVRKALMPGKRVSATGKIYWETRRNRSDVPGKNI